MRRLVPIALLAALALPAAARAQDLPQLAYAAPGAHIKRDAPLTFAVHTSARGTVMIRIAGSYAIGPDGLLTGLPGTWVDRKAAAATGDLRSWTAPARFLARRRPGTYYWQAYIKGGAAGPVQTLTVNQPAADRGRGRLYPRFGPRGHGSFYLSAAQFPKSVSGLRFQAVIRRAAKRWGLHAQRWTSVRAGRRDGYNVAGFSAGVPAGALGEEIDYFRHGRVVERDLALSSHANWAQGPAYPALDQIDLETVLLHELGHMAGVKPHAPRCTDSPMIAAFGEGEWWRGPRDFFFADCRRTARASSAEAPLAHRIVNLD
jgi:hypothetical protein